MTLSKIFRSALMVVVTVSMLLGGGVPLKPVSAAEPAFSTKTVDAGRSPSMSLDPGGSPKIAYCFQMDPAGATLNYQLRYAERTDRYNPAANWNWVVVESFPTNTGCSETVLKIDSTGTIHIAYLTGRSSTYEIKHATKSSMSSDWTIQVVDSSSTRIFRDLSLALTPTGLPRIAYYDSTNKDLMYARHDGTAWQTSFPLDSAGDVGRWASLVISKSGVEHIFYPDVTIKPNFKHAWQDGSGWQFETYEPINDPINGGTLAKAAVLDDGSLHVLYGYPSTCGTNMCVSIRYAKKVLGAWQEEEVTSYSFSTGSLTDFVIGVSQDGVPSISYQYWNGSPYGIANQYVWTKRDGAWAYQLMPQNYHMTSMEVDSLGNTHAAIFYCNYQYCTTQYAHKERSYLLSGRVLNRSGDGVQGVAVTAGATSVTTDANGNFSLTLSKGTATLVPSKAGVAFVQKNHRIAIPVGLPGNIVFTTTDYGAIPAPFLQFPIHLSSPDETIRALYPYGLSPGGRIYSWFDHRFPNNGTGNGDIDKMVLPYHLTITTEVPNYIQLLNAYRYSGHDGLDITGTEGTPVYSAYAGKVVKANFENDYGNIVVIDHSESGVPGYYTVYAHLQRILIAKDKPVTTETVIGLLGNTGENTTGPHLHFSVHRDDGTLNTSGNTYWNGVTNDKPVDPFGWLPNANGRNNLADPYVAEKAGPPSDWLWVESPPLNVQVIGSDGASVQDGTGKATLSFPAGFFTGIADLEFQRSPGHIAVEFWRSLGLTYRIELLNGLQNDPPDTETPAQSFALLDQVTSSQYSISMQYDPNSLAHLDESGLRIQRWDEDNQTWFALPSTIDDTTSTVTASTDRFGAFDLQAPLNCPADVLEVNDSADTASAFDPLVGSANQYLDIPLDQDWYIFTAPASQTATIQAYDLSESVSVQMTLYTEDLQAIASGNSSVTWSAQENTTYYLAVRSLEGGASGCTAVYSLRSPSPNQVFLPMLRR